VIGGSFSSNFSIFRIRLLILCQLIGTLSMSDHRSTPQDHQVCRVRKAFASKTFEVFRHKAKIPRWPVGVPKPGPTLLPALSRKNLK
jgi:hypothetical protein